MIICSCYAVNEETIRSELDARSGDISRVMEETGAGTCCGKCEEDLSKVFRQWRKEALARQDQ